MPTAAKSTAKRAPRTTKAAAPAAHVHPVTPSAAVCRACNALPMRSGEMLSLLLVLVFSLSAVLFTTVAALNIEKSKVSALRAALIAVNNSYVAPAPAGEVQPEEVTPVVDAAAPATVEAGAPAPAAPAAE